MAPGGPWRVTDRATFEALRSSSRRVRRGADHDILCGRRTGEPSPGCLRHWPQGWRSCATAIACAGGLRAIAFELGPDLQPGAYLIAAAPAAAGLSYGELRTIVSDGVKTVAGGRRS